MKIQNQRLILLLFCLALLPTIGRSNEKKDHFPISISGINHSWSFPFKNVFRMSPIYPGLSLETEYYYRDKEQTQLFQTAQMGIFFNSASGSGCFVNSNVGFRYTSKIGVFGDVSLGLGYFGSFYSSDTFVQNESGSYEPSGKSGVGALSANIACGLGYDFSKKTERNVSAFLRYQWIGSTYYWSLITIRPNGLLHLGVRFSPFSKK